MDRPDRESFQMSGYPTGPVADAARELINAMHDENTAADAYVKALVDASHGSPQRLAAATIEWNIARRTMHLAGNALARLVGRLTP